MSNNENNTDIVTSKPNSSNEFVEMMSSMLNLEGRRVKFHNKNTSTIHGGISSFYIDFINLPFDTGRTYCRAEMENNRVMFIVKGFDDKDPNASPPTGKVRTELVLMSFLDKNGKRRNMRTKTATPMIIAKYLSDFINTIVKEVKPNYTHTTI